MNQTNFEHVELPADGATPADFLPEAHNGATPTTATGPRRRRRRPSRSGAHGHQANPAPGDESDATMPAEDVSEVATAATEEAIIETAPVVPTDEPAYGGPGIELATDEVSPELPLGTAIPAEEAAVIAASEDASAPGETTPEAADMAMATAVRPVERAPETPATTSGAPAPAEPVPGAASAEMAPTEPSPAEFAPPGSVAGEATESAGETPMGEPPRPPRRYRFDRPAPAPAPTSVRVASIARNEPPAMEKADALDVQLTAAAPVELPVAEPATETDAEAKPAPKRRTRKRRRTSAGSSGQNGHALGEERSVAATAPESPEPVTGLAAGTASHQPEYTVSSGIQHIGEAQSPFASPEPTPARGFGSPPRPTPLSEGRTARTEGLLGGHATRTAHTSRSGEIPPLSTNQLATVLAQAIQNQTDRLLAELRRNQGPPSMTVTLPPFPSTERVGVFVDVANLLYSARSMRITVDFGKLLDFLRGNRRLVRAHAYCPTSPEPHAEQMFLMAVKGLGYRITTKNYKTFSSGAKKADLDLDLCMDVVRLVDAHAVDCIVLVSGDSDFLPLLDYCSEHGVRVEVAAFDEAAAAILRQSCDLFINLSVLQDVRM
jgi:uncharacterized LabA/DUF88 family protein